MFYFQVTIITPYKSSKPIPNIREVVFEENNIDKFMANAFEDGEVFSVIRVMDSGPRTCLKTLASDRVKDILAEDYDLAYVSGFFCDCFLKAIYEKQVIAFFIYRM